MSITVYRRDPDGSIHVVGCTDNECEIGIIMDVDRDKNDFADAQYATDPEVLSRQ